MTRPWFAVMVVTGCLGVAPTRAQVQDPAVPVVNPTSVQFDLSLDHDVPSGVADRLMVESYDLYIMAEPLQATDPPDRVAIVDLGKPPMPATGRTVTLLVPHFSQLAVTRTYYVLIASVGPGGQRVSDKSNPFTRRGGPPLPASGVRVIRE